MCTKIDWLSSEYNLGKVLFRAYENIELADRFES